MARDKAYYESKIKDAQFDIERWKLKIEELENPVISGKAGEPTKVVSLRVPASKANYFKKEFLQFIINNSQEF